MNRYSSDLFKPKYIKTLDREFYSKAFICKVKTRQNGDKYTQIYSKNKISTDCPLTGVCYDNNILQPVYDFLKKPTNDTLKDLFRDIESAIEKCYSDMDTWLYSEEFIKEELINQETEFIENGSIW